MFIKIFCYTNIFWRRFMLTPRAYVARRSKMTCTILCYITMLKWSRALFVWLWLRPDNSFSLEFNDWNCRCILWYFVFCARKVEKTRWILKEIGQHLMFYNENGEQIFNKFVSHQEDPGKFNFTEHTQKENILFSINYQTTSLTMDNVFYSTTRSLNINDRSTLQSKNIFEHLFLISYEL